MIYIPTHQSCHVFPYSEAILVQQDHNPRNYINHEALQTRTPSAQTADANRNKPFPSIMHVYSQKR